MFRILLLVTVVFCTVLASGIYAQDVGQRARELVAALDKTKYKKKEKKNISYVFYIDLKNEPVVKNNITEYAGVYECEDRGYRLELLTVANGAVEVGGYDTVKFDNSQRQNFRLSNTRIEGALLTGTKVFDNGQTDKLEAVFVNRTVASGKNRNEIAGREASYRLEFIPTTVLPAAVRSTDKNTWTNRVFLEFKK